MKSCFFAGSASPLLPAGRASLLSRSFRAFVTGHLLALVVAAVCFVGMGKVAAQTGDKADIDQSVPPAHWTLPEPGLRSPEETVAMFEMPPGFRAEVVAAEPLVEDPVKIAFDERGRLWVLEWPDYNRQLRGLLPGLETIEPPRGRLVVLEDIDGDGRYDLRTVFLDGIEWPRGFQVVRGGALVLKPPQLVLALDQNGDGKADREEVIVDGLEVPANPHGAANSVFYAMDNSVYIARMPLRLRRSADSATGWEPVAHVSLLGQWGLGQDDYGRLVYGTNGDHLRGAHLAGHYFLRNPNHPIAAAGADMSLARDRSTWPHSATPGTNRRTQLRDEDGTLRTFTANTHPTVYRGDQFPPEYRGDAFLGETAGRFLRRSVLSEDDGVLSGKNAYEEREFLFSHDERFRPVHTALGPDGALYVADMHRGIIEGHLFLTTYLRQQILDRGLHEPFHGLGRIYRIVHEDGQASPQPPVDPEAPASWLSALAHPNGFWRDTAQRVLVESGDVSVAAELAGLAGGHGDDRVRIHALWTLDGLGALDAATLGAAFGDPSHRVREVAARLSETRLEDRGLLASLISLAGDEGHEVRRQALLSLGEARGEEAEAAMESILRRDAARPFVVDAALSGLHGREASFLARILDGPDWWEEFPGAAPLLSALARAIANDGEIDALEPLLARLADSGEATAVAAWQREAVLGGMVEAKRRGLGSLPESLAALERSSEPSARKAAVALRSSWSAAPAIAAVSGEGVAARPDWQRGERLYVICAACHGAEGLGQPNIAPPLAESPVVAGPVEEVVRALLFGRNQDRANPAFPDMPPLSGLDDAEIASLAFYVKARWGGDSSPVEPSVVRALRVEGR